MSIIGLPIIKKIIISIIAKIILGKLAILGKLKKIRELIAILSKLKKMGGSITMAIVAMFLKRLVRVFLAGALVGGIMTVIGWLPTEVWGGIILKIAVATGLLTATGKALRELFKKLGLKIPGWFTL